MIKHSGMDVDYCGISNQDDFYNYESIIQFKYKIIDTAKQLSKICNFITDYKTELDYDWYMKIRPDIKLLDNINFDTGTGDGTGDGDGKVPILSKNAINGRARIYNGPSKIKYGMSINGEDCFYSDHEHNILIDDQIYIFHNNVVQQNAFNKIDPNMSYENAWNKTAPDLQSEPAHTEIFNNRNISLNIIGINCLMSKYHVFSGHINME